jgi:hypothetical protein
MGENRDVDIVLGEALTSASSRRSNEKGLSENALASYAFAVARYPAQRIVLWNRWALHSPCGAKPVGCLV